MSKMKINSTFVSKKQIKTSLHQNPTPGVKLLEPFKSFALKYQLPFKILEDTSVTNLPELHLVDGDLWHCLEGIVVFRVDGRLVKPQMRKNPNNTNNPNELYSEKMIKYKQIISKTGDWLWIPPGQAHQHLCKSVARLLIIKIPQS